MNSPSYLDGLSDENREILEGVISLIRKYPLLQRALIHCEENLGEKPAVAYNNIRDFLSHLRTLFDIWEKTTSGKDKLKAQLATAEEHLRRTIIESYELASQASLAKLEETYNKYIELVPKMRGKMNPSPLPIEEVGKKIRLIHELREGGREAKSENDWTPIWEEGIATFTRATEIAQELNEKLRIEIARADQIQREERTKTEQIQREKRWFWIQILGAIIIALIFYVLGHF